MKKQIGLCFLFLAALLTCEQSVLLPFIIFCYHLADNPPKVAFKKCSGVFVGFTLYLFFFLAQHVGHHSLEGNTYIVERWLWLAPQIFVHVVNLILIPVHLSIDQTALVKLAPAMVHPYSLFCLFICIGTIFCWLASFKYNKPLFLLLSGFLISLIPFLQLLTPTYCLTAERYFYAPLFFLVLGIGYALRK